MNRENTQPIIKTWELRNFQSIRGTKALDLKPLTIFSGPNSSGKSAVIKSLLMVAQSLSSSVREVPLVLNGKYIQLGDFNHILHHGSNPREMKLHFVIKQQEREIEVSILIAEGEDPTSMRVMDSTVSWGGSDGGFLTLEFCSIELEEGGIQNVGEILREQIDQGLFNYRIAKPRPEMVVSHPDYEEAVSASLSNFLPGRVLIRIALNVRELVEDLRQTGIALKSIVEADAEEVIDAALTTINDKSLDLDQELSSGAQAFFGLIPSAHWWSENYISTVRYISESETPWTIGALQEYIGQNLLESEIIDLVRRIAGTLPETMDSIDRHMELLMEEKLELGSDSTTELEDREFPSQYSQIIQQIRRVFDSQIFYLGPLRDDPRTIYAIPPLPNQRDVGLKGEYTAAMLAAYKCTEVYYPVPPSSGEKFEGEYRCENKELATAVTEWLKRMGLAESFDTDMISKVGYQLEIRPKGVQKDLDLMSLGVGVSQVLPIIVMALLAPEDSVLIFEQPEVHLHPKVQSVLGDFFLGIVACGKQCIVETHSEYLIHRIRRRIAESNDETILQQLGIYFVELKDGVSQFRLVETNEYGAISNWPADFFDEVEKESRTLLNAAMQKRSATMEKQQPTRRRRRRE